MISDLSCDALVIGAGPAGLSAALYIKRANADVLVVRGKVRSALALAHDIKNYAGITSIAGKQLLQEMNSQVEQLGVRFLDDDVIAMSLDMNPMMVSTKTAIITAKTIIVSTGKGARKPVLAGEESFIGMGVSYCATCDGPLYKGRPTVVIGDDREAAEDVLILDQMGSDVTWLIKDKLLEGCEVESTLVDRVKGKGIRIVEGARDLKLVGTDLVSGIEYTRDADAGVQALKTDCVFVMTSVPTVTLLSRAGIKLDGNNVVVDRQQNTSVKGVLACGDVCGNGFQVSIAVGEGAVAGMQAAKLLRQRQS